MGYQEGIINLFIIFGAILTVCGAPIGSDLHFQLFSYAVVCSQIPCLWLSENFWGQEQSIKRKNALA